MKYFNHKCIDNQKLLGYYFYNNRINQEMQKRNSNNFAEIDRNRWSNQKIANFLRNSQVNKSFVDGNAGESLF